jgi:chaperonin cofactor prefoldin
MLNNILNSWSKPTAKANLAELKSVADELARTPPHAETGQKVRKLVGTLEGQLGELEKEKTRLKGELDRTKGKLTKATNDLGRATAKLKQAKKP